MTNDDEEDNSLEAVRDVVEDRIKKDCSEFVYQHHTPSATISKELSIYTLLQLRWKLWYVDEDPLPSLLIGNMITGGLTKHSTQLHILLGAYFDKKISTICTINWSAVLYDGLKRFMKSSAKAKYAQMCNRRAQPTTVDGLV